jgi:hypothetical protein
MKQENSSNKMILMIPKSSYMPHNIQPDKILNISASTIALFLSFVVLALCLPLPPTRFSEHQIKSKICMKLFFVPIPLLSVVSCIRDKYLKKQNNCDSFFALWAFRPLPPHTTPSHARWSANKNQITNNTMIFGKEKHSTYRK